MNGMKGMKAAPAVLSLSLLLCSLAGFAQEPAPPAAPAAPTATTATVHDELRKVRDEIIAAIGRGDIDAVLVHLHPNVVFTPLNNQTCRGPAEIRAYFDKMMKGPNPVVKSMQLKMEVDRLTDLYGDLQGNNQEVGIASGSSDDRYVLTNGLELAVRSRWTCSLVRENGRWLITGFHSSASLFDNPLLNRAKEAARWAGITAGVGAGIAGLLLGFFLGRRRRA